ncbi:MAG: hypothetical protein OES34_12080 [Nitrosopumilus sp.]|nr:hypothetical protein [Nitrosopumilus sp.]
MATTKSNTANTLDRFSFGIFSDVFAPKYPPITPPMINSTAIMRSTCPATKYLQQL